MSHLVNHRISPGKFARWDAIPLSLCHAFLKIYDSVFGCHCYCHHLRSVLLLSPCMPAFLLRVHPILGPFVSTFHLVSSRFSLPAHSIHGGLSHSTIYWTIPSRFLRPKSNMHPTHHLISTASSFIPLRSLLFVLLSVIHPPIYIPNAFYFPSSFLIPPTLCQLELSSSYTPSTPSLSSFIIHMHLPRSRLKLHYYLHSKLI